MNGDGVGRPKLPAVTPNTPMTYMEIAIASFISRTGANTSRIGYHFGIANDTVKHHLTKIYEKTQTYDRIDLMLNWRCEIFQIGLRAMGIIPKSLSASPLMDGRKEQLQ